jgi:hypothetical protein
VITNEKNELIPTRNITSWWHDQKIDVFSQV